MMKKLAETAQQLALARLSVSHNFHSLQLRPRAWSMRQHRTVSDRFEAVRVDQSLDSHLYKTGSRDVEADAQRKG